MDLIEYEYVLPVELSRLAMQSMVASFPPSLKADIKRTAYIHRNTWIRPAMIWRGIAWMIRGRF